MDYCIKVLLCITCNQFIKFKNGSDMTHLGKTLIAIATIASASVQAEQISIVNPSFEDVQLSSGNWTYPNTEHDLGSIPGWVGTPWSGGVWRPAANLLTPSDGNQVAFSNGPDGNGNTIALSQTLTTVLKANTQYTLQVDLINRLDTSTNKSSTIELLAGGHVLASSTIIGGLQGTTVLQSVSFLSGASETYLGQNLGITLSSGNLQSDWDNVRLTAAAPVPEPETYAMLLAGLGLMGAVARRKHK
jgi:hypothetical protein